MSGPSGIYYCAISRGQTILCHNQREQGNYDAVANSMLPNINAGNSKRTTYDGGDQCTFHVVIQNGIIYLCATSSQYRKSRAFAFLDEVVSRFTGGSLIVRATSSGYLELQKDFAHVLGTQMAKFSKEENDNISQLQAQVNEVKGVMTENIDKVLQRGERLDDLLDKTTDLEASTETFRRTTRRVARKYWWQNMKMKLIIAAVVIVVLVVLILVICGSTGVFNKKPAATTVAPTVGSTIKADKT